jgi:hypothetical protein
MLDIDEGGGAAHLLRFGDDLQCDGGFTRGFWTEDFADTAARQTAYA